MQPGNKPPEANSTKGTRGPGTRETSADEQPEGTKQTTSEEPKPPERQNISSIQQRELEDRSAKPAPDKVDEPKADKPEEVYTSNRNYIDEFLEAQTKHDQQQHQKIVEEDPQPRTTTQTPDTVSRTKSERHEEDDGTDDADEYDDRDVLDSIMSNTRYWAERTMGQMNDMFNRAGVNIPREWSAELDKWRIRASEIYGKKIKPEEFWGASAVAAMIAGYLYVTFCPWAIRLMVTLGLAATQFNHILTIVSILTLAPTAWNAVASHQYQAKESHSNITMIIGFVAASFVMTGKLGAAWTFSFVLVGTLIFLYGLSKKAANHSTMQSFLGIGVIVGVLMTSGLCILAYPYYIDFSNCGELLGKQYRNCVQASREQTYQKIMDRLKNSGTAGSSSNISWTLEPIGAAYSLMSFLCVIAAVAALNMPSVINVLGRKYKLAGRQAQQAIKNAKDGKTLDYSTVKICTTPADYSLTSDNIPMIASYCMAVLGIALDWQAGAFYLTSIAAGHAASIVIFKCSLATDFAQEGGESVNIQDQMPDKDTTSFIGQTVDIGLTKRASYLVTTLLSVAVALTGVSVGGPLWFVLFVIPFATYTLAPHKMGMVALATMAAATVTTRVPLMIIGTIATMGYAARTYSMKMKAAQTEIVISDIPSGERTNSRDI